jgi:hypothetical protein
LTAKPSLAAAHLAVSATMSGVRARRYVVVVVAIVAACACALVELASPSLPSAASRVSFTASTFLSMGLTATESVGETSSGSLWAVVGSGEILSEDGGAQWHNISSDGVPDRRRGVKASPTDRRPPPREVPPALLWAKC